MAVLQKFQKTCAGASVPLFAWFVLIASHAGAAEPAQHKQQSIVFGQKSDRLDIPQAAKLRTKDQREKNWRGKIFNSLAFRTNSAREHPVWNRVREKISTERAVYAMCDGGGSLCSPRLRKWRRNLKAARKLKGTRLLRHLNASVNALAPYVEDSARFGARDYWASPLEFLARGGDCEDFAILKYVSLKELGIPEQNLHLVVVHDLRNQNPHAVLSVDLGDKTWILDSLDDKLVGKTAKKRFMPRYSVSGDERWIYVKYRRTASRF